ncbi:hypothetical protein MOF20_09365 [Bacillus haynesii]|uniref:hypothetical protein n=1 Tax=Bacillus haynesii TaxID=1925021 RepID=UPI00227EDE51|nr:hypothetical protein [Bacillus haynesii]MCY9263418.1 hypothetical protein [Bacillus haynesii]
MDIQKPRAFRTTDKAHADLFNQVIDQLNTNDESIAQFAAEAEQRSTAYTDKHISKKDNPHGVTKSQVGLGEVINKRQATKDEFDLHHKDQTRHVSEDERNKWNGSQLFNITGDNGQAKVYISAEDDFQTVLPQYTGLIHFTAASGALNGPGAAVRGIWTCNALGNYGQAIAFDNANRTYRKTISGGNWTDWTELISVESLEAKLTNLTWHFPTLLNEWVNYADSTKVRYTKDATGTVFVEGAIAKGKIGFDIPAFVLPKGYRPSRAFQLVGVASQLGMSNIPQYHRLQVSVDGNVVIENCSNTVNPNEYISLGFSFKAT